ncbi:MAG: hypothetical protein EPO07_08465 [Verrucomicrobia bacterium]|nr:MAG: hypothetical protein EPO07_08465 [Verrucomicrobiota bacterium]
MGHWQLTLLFLTGLAAGFVDTIAGGGGLITLPVMLGCGFDPKLALGTNKFQATFGSGSAAWHFSRAGAVAWRDCARGFMLTFVGAALGTLAVQQLDPSFLKRGLPILLVAVAVYSILKPDLGVRDLHPKMESVRFDFIFGLGIGFYDGFFGPGTGTFWAMAFVLMLGFNLTRATAHTKVMNFGSNLASLLFFLLAKKVLFVPGLAMGGGQLLGAWLGSHLVVKGGTKFIRPIFISVVLAITGKVLYDAWLR